MAEGGFDQFRHTTNLGVEVQEGKGPSGTTTRCDAATFERNKRGKRVSNEILERGSQTRSLERESRTKVLNVSLRILNESQTIDTNENLERDFRPRV